MNYKGKWMLFHDYYKTRMKEAGFWDNNKEIVNGAYRTETEYNICAEYISSCDMSLSEIEDLELLGYSYEDFTEPTIYEVVIESGKVKNVLLATMSYKEALECYEAYNSGNGDYEDPNGFVWDLYIEEEEV